MNPSLDKDTRSRLLPVGLAWMGLGVAACGGATSPALGGGSDASTSSDVAAPDATLVVDASSAFDAGGEAALPSPDAGTGLEAATEETDAGPCGASVLFDVLPGGKTFCSGPSPCGPYMLVSVRPLGDAGALLLDSFCYVSCSSCVLGPCPPIACEPPYVLDAQGYQQSWDGTYLADETCGDAGRACSAKTCVAPGTYVATACAYEDVTPDAGSTMCTGASTPTCNSVTLLWPPSTGHIELPIPLGAVSVGP